MTKSGRTVLLVDDDVNITDTAKDILEDAGYKVETAGTCSEALKKLSSTAIDAAIIDFNLPDGQGTDLAIKGKAITPTLIILLMTGEPSIDLGSAKDLVHSVLTKPVNPMDLIRLLDQMI